MAAFYLKKKATEDSRWGVELTAQAGKDAELFGFSATAPNMDGYKVLRQLGPTNVSYLAPVGKGLTIQGGIFSSFIGYDSLYAKDNFNYTRPWGADFTPYFMLGVNVSYPFTKRFFALPQAYLGIAFGFGIPMAYAAVQERLPFECWLLLAANVFYAFAYDTEYAMVDRDDDARLGIRTSALTLGRWDVFGVMASYGLMLALLTAVGALRGLAWPYYAGLGLAAAMMLYHWTLIRSRSREGCFSAFRHNNWVGAAVFAGIAAAFALP
jgi:hypothetical protein